LETYCAELHFNPSRNRPTDSTGSSSPFTLISKVWLLVSGFARHARLVDNVLLRTPILNLVRIPHESSILGHRQRADGRMRSAHTTFLFYFVKNA
jgi:hypothetical protein